MSTVNERAARRWEAERDRRMLDTWAKIAKQHYFNSQRYFNPPSKEWQEQV